MRWFWVDRFTELVSGSHATGVKNVALDQEVVDGYCLCYPMFPPTLVTEGIAQLGGILIHEHTGFQKRVVLAKVSSARFHQVAKPGDSLIYHAKLGRAGPHGATLSGSSHIDGKLHAEMELMFAFLDENLFVEGSLFGDGELRGMLRLMNFFQVAVGADGQPVPYYEHV